MKVLVSAGEASGDLYAAGVTRALGRRFPQAKFFGCPGPRMETAGVRAVIDQRKLAVVGLVEVVKHLPAIHGEYRKLIAAAEKERPALAILTDSSGFHLRVARALKDRGIPVVYLVAPQAWAWRKSRVNALRRNVDRLLCIFPFEEEFFRSFGVAAHYIGHPLTRLIAPRGTREEFFARYGLALGKPLVALLPGSRTGEIARHLPILRDTVARIEAQFVLATPAGLDDGFIREALPAVRIARGESWDSMAYCDVALAASGTVTVEAALLGAPMATFYRVSALTWWLGRRMVRVPFYSMANLVAGRRIVAELIQDDATGERLAAEANRLLADTDARAAMREDLAGVARALASDGDPLELAADHAAETIERHRHALG
ncbi:MAG: lipid-A-disaccharide synthase [Bryobacteraceae bacterium]|nr:lipid-A-disaccharide synthase [Bryobacteraceae bacterium]